MWSVLLLALLLTFPVAQGVPRWLPGRGFLNHFERHESQLLLKSFKAIRGGHGADEERYSRQIYTLGARAHGFIRSATVYLDGPPSSGLLFECAKNLALSGVGNIVILTSNDASENLYHVKAYDDLGQAYGRAARSELGYGLDDGATDEAVLLEFILRLNPSVSVTIMKRSELESTDNGVLLSIDRPQQSQLLLNKLCRQLGLKFVAVETVGVYGRTFCDFGPIFEVIDGDGETPLVIPFQRIEEEEEGIFTLHCIEGEKHDVSKGDHIQFQLSNGGSFSPPCIVKEVYGPFRLSAQYATEDTSLTDFVSIVNKQAASFSRLKIPRFVRFVSMEEALIKAGQDASLFVPCDLDKSFDPIRRAALLSCFQSLPLYLEANQKFPSRGEEDQFRALMAATNASENHTGEWKSLVDKFTQCCAAKLTPMQGIIGAIGAQEALKAVSGFYNPVTQFLLYDCDELLGNDSSLLVVDGIGAKSGQEYILGSKLCTHLANKNLFVVGAGAIGCELLKNLSAMGACTNKGRVVVTDMDTIEKSNLSRQLLFRDADIGKFKSKAAEAAVRRFNPTMNMQVHTSKVGDEENGHFNDFFWANDVGVVLNALDNVEARLFMDKQCVTHKKPLVDAGTLGSKGNVQVVVPGQSESYGFSVDPPDPSIPVCTLKNFPYAIAHTIQWGRDLFEGYFERRPKQANEFRILIGLQGPRAVAKKLIKDLGGKAAVKIAEELTQDLRINSSSTSVVELRQEAVKWASTEAKTLFSGAIGELLTKHPADSVDEDGKPFWSGTRRLPRPLNYNSDDDDQRMIDENLIGFVRAGGRLRMETLSTWDGQEEISREEAIEAILVTREETCHATTDLSDEAYDRVIRSLEFNATGESNLCGIEFEKDDERNGHVDFVTAASNLRALCYGIAPVDAMETRRVAGRIVPAMITTTAFVSALSCLELLKLLQDAPLQRHRNAFINLALPFFAFTPPLPAEKFPGLRGSTYTEWDRIVVKESKKAAAKGGITLQGLLVKIKKKLLLEDDGTVAVSSISFGSFLIYASFLHEDDKQLLNRPLWEVIRQAVEAGDDDEFAGRDDLGSSRAHVDPLRLKGFVDLTVVIEDLQNEEEVQLPPVRVRRRNVKR
jgi:ubiquitin-activating enzyme E1